MATAYSVSPLAEPAQYDSSYRGDRAFVAVFMSGRYYGNSVRNLESLLTLFEYPTWGYSDGINYVIKSVTTV